MFWNNEFLNAAPSVFDTLLQSDTTKLSDILFHEDLLQELRTSNLELTNYLAKPEIINELVDNITGLTEKDCYDKLLYSKVHAAYISCEILTAGSTEITDALLYQTNSITKVISCLVRQPRDDDNDGDNDDDDGDSGEGGRGEEKTADSKEGTDSNKTDPQEDDQSSQQRLSLEQNSEDYKDEKELAKLDDSADSNQEFKIESNTTTVPQGESTDETQVASSPSEEKQTTPTEEPAKEHAKPSQCNDETQAQAAPTQLDHPADAAVSTPAPSQLTPPSSSPSPTLTSSTSSTPPIDTIKVVPQKAALISKLINNIHSTVPADLSCPITKNIEIFAALIQVLVNNIEVSGSYEILSTFISRTNPPEIRYVFCEILSKLNFVFSLIDVMTISNVEDKQRNACQLLCDIIVIGRQEANEQITNHGPAAQDMLADLIESKNAVRVMLNQMFSRGTVSLKESFSRLDNHRAGTPDKLEPEANATESHTRDVGDCDSNHKGADGLDKCEPLSNNHNGVGETHDKESRAGSGDDNDDDDGESGDDDGSPTDSPNKTAIVCGMKVLQTLVERKHAKNNANLVSKTIDDIQDEIAENLASFHELLLNPPKQEPIKTTFGVIQKPLGYIRLEVVNLIRELLSTGSSVIIKKLVELKTFKIIIDLFVDYSWNNLLHTQVEQAVHLIIKNCRRDEDLKYQVDMQKHSANNIVEPVNYDLPSLALLSQLLNECDLIGRLLLPNKNGEQANFGHIIQMINSIAISCDLDTIKDHLNEMKEKRAELYARWTNFVNVDVASFKAISFYFDVQSVSKHNDNNYDYLQKRNDEGYYSNPSYHRPYGSALSNNSTSTNNDVKSLNGDDQIMTYFSFTRETVIPSINIDVLPNSRRAATTNKNNY